MQAYFTFCQRWLFHWPELLNAALVHGQDTFYYFLYFYIDLVLRFSVSVDDFPIFQFFFPQYLIVITYLGLKLFIFIFFHAIISPFRSFFWADIEEANQIWFGQTSVGSAAPIQIHSCFSCRKRHTRICISVNKYVLPSIQRFCKFFPFFPSICGEQ